MKIKGVIFDLDGVLRIGDKAIEGSNDVFEFLDTQHIPYIIATNECRHSPVDLKKKLWNMNINVHNEAPIYTAGLSVKKYLQIKANRHYEKKIHIGVVGEKGLIDLLDEDSMIVIHDAPDNIPIDETKYLVVGTVDKIEMHHLEKVRNWIHSGAKVITTCCDMSDPSSRGSFSVGMPNLLIHMAFGNVSDAYSTGKPNVIFAKDVYNEMVRLIGKVEPHELLFVGDTLYTDIRMAEEFGFSSALVLTGNAKPNNIDDYVSEPDFIINSVRDVPDLIWNLNGNNNLL